MYSYDHENSSATWNNIGKEVFGTFTVILGTCFHFLLRMERKDEEREEEPLDLPRKE